MNSGTVVPGQVVRLTVEGVAHEKYVIVLVLDDGLGLFINTREYKPAEANVLIAQASNPFLHRDSFAYLQPIRVDDMAAQIVADPKRVVGTLHDSTKQDIVQAANGSKVLSPDNVKLISSRLRTGA